MPVLKGAAEELVSRRELRTTYRTNRDIKTWAAYFVLKSITTSGVLHNWQAQGEYLANLLQCSEDTLVTRVEELAALSLVQPGVKPGSIVFASFEDAAKILDIPFCGTIKIKYDLRKHKGKQFFRFILMSEEFRCAKNKQVEALVYYLSKNPLLMQQLEMLLVKLGAIPQKLRDPHYFQERLLELQLRTFRDGSECYDIIMQVRADCNRSAKRIKKDHCYRSEQTVAYWKRVLVKHEIITIRSRTMESNVRSRLYYINSNDARVEACKWLRRKKQTKLFLCHQVQPLHELASAPQAATRPAAAA